MRNLGWKRTAKGRAQQKFYLGRDETAAKIASLKLEQLWEAVCARWKAATPLQPRRKPDPATQFAVRGSASTRTGENPVPSGVSIVMAIGIGEVEYVREGEPVWDDVSLSIAEAIRNGEAIARVPVPEPLGQAGLTSPSVGEWLDQLRRTIPFIHIELRDTEQQSEAESEIRVKGLRLIDEGRRIMRSRKGGETLHAALDAYGGWLAKTRVDLDGRLTPNGNTQIRQVEFVRRHLPNCELGELTGQQIESFEEVLRMRPATKRGTRSSVRSTKNYMKQFRAFIEWLNRTPQFQWSRPPELTFGSFAIPETTAEISGRVRASRVLTYTEDELAILWEYGSPLQRTLMLLGLNCGFGAKEIATLEMEDVHLRTRHPHEQEVGVHGTDEDSWILRVRNKTGVYGEWKLWPETAAALEWWLQQRSQIAIREETTALLVNRNGHRYDRPTANNDRNVQIPNRWNALTTKIRKDKQYASFRKLSFGKLRKTAGNLIRSEAGGEVAGIFLCHGTPVKADELLDVYTNRPFPKVFDAIDQVGQRLRPLWKPIKEPFPEHQKKGGNNIGQSTIRRIQSLRGQGFKVAHIAATLGVSPQTVSRHSSVARQSKKL